MDKPSLFASFRALLPVILISMMTSASMMLAGYLLYAHFHRQQTVVSVDLSRVVKARESSFLKLLEKPGATDEDRANAYRLAQSLGPEIEKAIGVLQARCDCVVLTHAAVIAGTTDLTTQLETIMDEGKK